MIGVIFSFANEIIEVRIDGFNCLFRNNQTHGSFYPIEGLRLDKAGVFKEHPDLMDDDEWKKEAIKRFKEKIKSYEDEKERIKYVIEDLSNFGYKPLYLQKNGSRPKKIG